MTPFEFLNEELENVERALGETLRRDYGPERSREYYEECANRLKEIRGGAAALNSSELTRIWEYLCELSSVSSWISLIERSHLGEFSWPFAEELRRIATSLLPETTLKGDPLDPIIHVIAEGYGYQIVFESQIPTISSRRRFVIVAFPRSLKHHVLLHAIFGHELGHTALHSTNAGSILQSDVMPALKAAGPMANKAEINAWLHDAAAPQEFKGVINDYFAHNGTDFQLPDKCYENWLVELTCDLFGLLLFGPGFLAAHRLILQPMSPNPYDFDLDDPTHPPYAVRHKMLARLMRLLKWDAGITEDEHGEFQGAEKEFLGFLLYDPYESWADVFDDTNLVAAISGVRKIFASHGMSGYTPTTADELVGLVGQLKKGVPPIIGGVDSSGTPNLKQTDITQILYAGWVYWIGHAHFTEKAPLTFFLTNRLCDHALLQQRAINEFVGTGVV